MEKLTTMSDIGGVLVGTKEIGVILTNGRGDGETKVLIIKKGEIETTGEYNFFTSLNGKFNIYNYDCSKRDDADIIKSIEGRYGIYYNSGTVVFEEWDS